MTREQHLEAARRAGQIARSNHWRAVSDHPFDNDQDECAESAVLWVAIALRAEVRDHGTRHAMMGARAESSCSDPGVKGRSL